MNDLIKLNLRIHGVGCREARSTPVLRVCPWSAASVCACVCVRVRERERERVCVCVSVSE